jgi:hypothetical protein
LGNFTCQTDFEAGLPGIANPSAPFDPLQCQRFSCLNEQYNAASPANTQFLRVGTPLREYCPATVSSQPSRRQTDYEAVSLNTSDPSEPLFSGTTFLIDATTRPEPLASLLQGVHSGMEAFEARGTGADQFGFAAVDDDFLPLRSTNFNSALGLPSLVKTGGPDGEFDRFLEATDYAAQESLPLASRPFIQNLLIPRQFSGKSFQRRNPGAYAQSDLAGVFSESLDILKNAPNSDIAASSLIMFTDGMASCHGGSCSISNATLNRRAINSIIAQARDEFAAAGIAFHVFLMSKPEGKMTRILPDKTNYM